MKSAITRILTLILALAMLTLTACINREYSTNATEEVQSSQENKAPSTDETASSSSIQEPSEQVPSGLVLEYYSNENNWPQGPDISGAPVTELTDLKRVTEVYVLPLTANGSVWFESWSSPSEIPANTLTYICAYNEWVEYDASDPSVQPFAPAEEVEAALQKHFDITTDYLRTSTSYNAEKNAYPMSEGGGGWGAFALSAEQAGSQITIKVGSMGPEETVPEPMGTLVIELTEQNVVKYRSYQVSEAHSSQDSVSEERREPASGYLRASFQAESATKTVFYTLDLPEDWTVESYGAQEGDSFIFMAEGFVPSTSTDEFTYFDEVYSNATSTAIFEVSGYPAKMYELTFEKSGNGEMEAGKQFLYFVKIDDEYLLLFFTPVPSTVSGKDVFDTVVGSFKIE